MMRTARFLVVLVCGLGVLSGVALAVLDRTTRAWFAKDIRLRNELAVYGARRALVATWGVDGHQRTRELLTDIARDERIMAGAACDGGRVVTSTDDFPPSIGCDGEARGVRDVTVSVMPVRDDSDREIGAVLLVHDLSYLSHREATLRRFLFIAFVILAITASIVTLVARRLSWRGFMTEVRRLVRGENRLPELAPLIADVRELVDRLSSERELENGAWTPLRLKQSLSRNLQGERVIVVANREPYIHERDEHGAIQVVHPASGLVTALEPVMRACSGVWVAHGSGGADRETADRAGRVRVPPGEESYLIRRVWLDARVERGYYYGFSNEGLWPLCHMAHTRPMFRIEDWRHYRTANERFADAVCDEVEGDDPIVFVQDYHLALVPQLLRERLPRATIISFWHIPWPNAEQLGVCPWHEELLHGLLGSSIVGFQTQLHCNNFLDAVDRNLEARIDRERDAVVQRRRTTLIRAYPISIEWPNQRAESSEPVERCRAEIRAELGLPQNALIGLGVDRLDYTKGIEERLLAVERLIEREPSMRGRFSFIQLAAPSRTVIDRYRELNERVESLAARINARFASGSYRPIILLRAHHEPPNVFRHYRAADVCYVSSLHDGMNLVAKEFVAARTDLRGVLVLSRFTGAARELTEALIVNPYDLEEASQALALALRMPIGEQQDRMRAMRNIVGEFNVYRWAGRMLMDAARLRRHDRLSARLPALATG